MFHKPLHGFIEVIAGGMFSGKTEELLRRLRRCQIGRQKIQVFKPKIDTRYSDNHVQSHDSGKTLSVPIQSSQEILDHLEDNTRVVGIDEAQFFDQGLVQIAQKLAYRGIRVIIAGLDMDFRGQPFGPMPDLMAVSEDVTKLSAVCVVCGNPATRSQRIVSSEGQDGPTVLVGAMETYEARCRFCHEPSATSARPIGLVRNHEETETAASPSKSDGRPV